MQDKSLYKNYTKTRFTEDKNREIVWRELALFFQKFVNPQGKILEIGSGYCYFINFIKAKEKYALDKYMDPNEFANENVVKLFGDFSLAKKKIKDSSLDVIFASNILEHLDRDEIEEFMEIAKSKLKPDGNLILVHPNYKYAYRDYFDDFTHKTIWSHVSLTDFLKSKEFQLRVVMPKFLPHSIKSRFPKSRLLVRLYLKLPFKIFAKQMLIIARNKK